MYWNPRFDFSKGEHWIWPQERLFITRSGLSILPCSRFYLQGLRSPNGLGEGMLGWRGHRAAKPWPPPLPPVASGTLLSSCLTSGPCSQNVCYSLSTIIYCYLPFYSPSFPRISFLFYLLRKWKEDSLFETPLNYYAFSLEFVRLYHSTKWWLMILIKAPWPCLDSPRVLMLCDNLCPHDHHPTHAYLLSLYPSA